MGRAKAKPINEGWVGLGIVDGLVGGAIGGWFDWAGVDVMGFAFALPILRGLRTNHRAALI